MSLSEVYRTETALEEYLSDGDPEDAPTITAGGVLRIIATLHLIEDAMEEQRARMRAVIEALEDQLVSYRAEVAVLRGEIPRVSHGPVCPCNACSAAYGPIH